MRRFNKFKKKKEAFSVAKKTLAELLEEDSHCKKCSAKCQNCLEKNQIIINLNKELGQTLLSLDEDNDEETLEMQNLREEMKKDWVNLVKSSR